MTSSSKHGGVRKLPYAFTEQGVSMLSALLKSDKAIETSIKIMDAFVAMRRFLLENANYFRKFEQIDQKLIEYDNNLNKIFNVLENKLSSLKFYPLNKLRKKEALASLRKHGLLF